MSSDFDERLAVDESPEYYSNPPLLPQVEFSASESQPDENLLPVHSLRPKDSYIGYPASPKVSAVSPRPETPGITERAKDDAAVSSRPSRQVDYLSHDWKEEDIWSSWRYIISKRVEFANSARLENASWRSWMKTKGNLKTISPEELNWLKDCDYTWLYGPLQCDRENAEPTHTDPYSLTLSKTDSLTNSNIDCSVTDFPSTRRGNRGARRFLAWSTTSSDISSSTLERKQVQFNEQVEQCISIDVKEDGDDDFVLDRTDDDEGVDGSCKGERETSRTKRWSKKPANSDRKLISKLASTTLNYRDDISEPQEAGIKHSTDVSSSQETLNPTPSSRLCFGEKYERDDGLNVRPVTFSSGSRSPPRGQVEGVLRRPSSPRILTDEPQCIRQTPSGRFMPNEEREAPAGDGIIGRVMDTVNTTRDVAHII
ncbi:HEX2 protein-like protein, partial [Metarhizium majus ARSEF 297]